MRRLAFLLALMGLFLLGIAPAGALSPGYEEVPFTDGALCNFTGQEARYGTPGYPGNEDHPEITEMVLQKYHEFEDGQGRVHQSFDIRMDGVQYDLLSGEGPGPPASFLVYGTITGHGWYDENEAFMSFGWRWTLTDLDGNSLGTNTGRIVDFAVAGPRLVHNWQGPCFEP
jgi:hypothetical protein